MTSIKKALTSALVILCVVSSLAMMACSSQSSTSSSSSVVVEEDTGIAVLLSIDGTAAGAEVQTFTISVPEGASVLDALVASSVDTDIEDSSYGPFVSSIDGIANGSEGAQSGWTYTVNDEYATVGASEFVLSDGDAVVWTFVV